MKILFKSVQTKQKHGGEVKGHPLHFHESLSSTAVTVSGVTLPSHGHLRGDRSLTNMFPHPAQAE